MDSNLHNSLKTALMLDEQSISEYSRNLVRPDGTIGVSHSFVIASAKGEEKTAWIREAIEKTIHDSKLKHPEYWTRRRKFNFKEKLNA